MAWCSVSQFVGFVCHCCCVVTTVVLSPYHLSSPLSYFLPLLLFFPLLLFSFISSLLPFFSPPSLSSLSLLPLLPSSPSSPQSLFSRFPFLPIFSLLSSLSLFSPPHPLPPLLNSLPFSSLLSSLSHLSSHPLPLTPSQGSSCQRESYSRTLFNVFCSNCLCLHPTKHRISQNAGDTRYHRECSPDAYDAEFPRY